MKEDTLYKNGYLAGKLLLAVPSMSDPRFQKAVIFLCAHDEKGAMGLAINNVMPDILFPKLLEQLKIDSGIALDPQHINIPVHNGGPVEAARGFLLHSGDFRQAETIRIDNDYCVTGTLDALKAIAIGQGPRHVVFALGYAGWGAGQLEAEIQQNSWLVADPDPNLVYHALPEERWDMALSKIGIEPGMLSSQTGRA